MLKQKQCVKMSDHPQKITDNYTKVVRNNKAMVRESRSVGTSLSGSKRL
jgi:hypothetical protein